MKTLLEVREYRFQDGTTLLVELDRRTQKASFVQWDDQKQKYVPTNFKFAGRKIQYMNGWHNILSAMQYVTVEAKKQMQAWKDESAEEFLDVLMMLAKNDDIEKRKAK